MKFTITAECTPEEARAFMGLPDVQPMQEAMMKDLQDRMRANMAAMDPETIMKTWVPASLQGAEQFQKMFWSHMEQAMRGMTTMGNSFGDKTQR